MDPDQDQQNVSPDLDPNYLNSDSVPERIFFNKLILKKSAENNKSTKNYSACKELRYSLILYMLEVFLVSFFKNLFSFN